MTLTRQVKIAMVGVMLNSPSPSEWHLGELDDMKEKWPDEYAIAVEQWRARDRKKGDCVESGSSVITYNIASLVD